MSAEKFYKEAFDKFDHNRDGSICTQELDKVMKEAGKNLTQCELKKIVDALDKDGNGKIDYKEFLAFVEPLVREHDKLFHELDKDGSGYITADELKAALSGCPDITPHDIAEIIKHSDKDGNGKIDLNEFRGSLL